MQQEGVESPPHLSGFRETTRTFWYGMCMGACDIVPGISGGTIAFIMGFYEDLIHSIQSINVQAIRKLLRGEWHLFFSTVSWDFLLALLLGAAFSLVLLAQSIDQILQHDVYRTYLYAAFFGLILASTWVCVKKIPRWKRGHFVACTVGAITSWLLTHATGTLSPEPLPLFSVWMVFCGACAVCAMLLPGISGSYVLVLLGVYPTVIRALAEFSRGLQALTFSLAPFMVLVNLGIGIVIGALLFSRAISWLLSYYHNTALALLTGFMVGALGTLWPWDIF